MKYIKMFILVAASLVACSVDDMNTYDAGRYIYFTQDLQTDSIVRSFFFYPDSASIGVKVILSYAGEKIKKDYNYLLGVDEDITTASDDEYSFERNQVWEAGKEQDTVEIRLKRSARLDTKYVRLVVKVAANENFNVGPAVKEKAIFSYTSQVIAPLWWDESIIKSYLGAYSEAKYAAFMRATGIISMEGMDAGEKRYYSLKFKYELIRIKNETGKPMMDGNVEMTVPILG